MTCQKLENIPACQSNRKISPYVHPKFRYSSGSSRDSMLSPRHGSVHQDHYHVLEQFFYAPGKGAGSFLRLHDGKRTEPGRIKLSNYRGTC